MHLTCVRFRCVESGHVFAPGTRKSPGTYIGYHRGSPRAACCMITEHALLYLGARLFAAGANLAAVAIFTRLAASDVYGGYLLIFSWAFVLYGFLGQWLGAAFFAVYAQETSTAQIGT